LHRMSVETVHLSVNGFLRRSVRISAALLLMVIGREPAAACDCGRRPACFLINNADAVFVGKVVFTDHDPSKGTAQRTLVRFNVEESFKGLAGSTRGVWIDPGSFTSCYNSEYEVGDRYLVFASMNRRMPDGADMMSIVPESRNTKPLPPGIDPKAPPIVYLAAGCSGTRHITHDTNDDLKYLRRYKAGTATRMVIGRVLEDASFGESPPGLAGVNVTLTGNGRQFSAITDSEGRYTFDDVPIGIYLVTPSLEPYESSWSERETEVPLVGCGFADFDMQAPGVIEGTLLDHKGRTLPDVQVEVLRLAKDGSPMSRAEHGAVTNAQGHYRFEDMPSGDFAIGVNLYDPPNIENPYSPTRWSENKRSTIHLVAGAQQRLSPLKLPRPLTVRLLEAEVRWPDGRPATGVDVWALVKGKPGALAKVDAAGMARLSLLEGIHYSVEAMVWVGREVARSGSIELTPESEPILFNLTMNRRSRLYF
jgi:hypothetical protein